MIELRICWTKEVGLTKLDRNDGDVARMGRPQLQVLFVTGYAENAFVGNGVLEHGMAVLTKPFDLDALVEKVRSMVDMPAAEH